MNQTLLPVPDDAYSTSPTQPIGRRNRRAEDLAAGASHTTTPPNHNPRPTTFGGGVAAAAAEHNTLSTSSDRMIQSFILSSGESRIASRISFHQHPFQHTDGDDVPLLESAALGAAQASPTGGGRNGRGGADSPSPIYNTSFFNKSTFSSPRPHSHNSGTTPLHRVGGTYSPLRANTSGGLGSSSHHSSSPLNQHRARLGSRLKTSAMPSSYSGVWRSAATDVAPRALRTPLPAGSGGSSNFVHSSGGGAVVNSGADTSMSEQQLPSNSMVRPATLLSENSSNHSATHNTAAQGYYGAGAFGGGHGGTAGNSSSNHPYIYRPHNTSRERDVLQYYQNREELAVLMAADEAECGHMMGEGEATAPPLQQDLSPSASPAHFEPRLSLSRSSNTFNREEGSARGEELVGFRRFSGGEEMHFYSEGVGGRVPSPPFTRDLDSPSGGGGAGDSTTPASSATANPSTLGLPFKLPVTLIPTAPLVIDDGTGGGGGESCSSYNHSITRTMRITSRLPWKAKPGPSGSPNFVSQTLQVQSQPTTGTFSLSYGTTDGVDGHSSGAASPAPFSTPSPGIQGDGAAVAPTERRNTKRIAFSECGVRTPSAAGFSACPSQRTKDRERMVLLRRRIRQFERKYRRTRRDVCCQRVDSLLRSVAMEHFVKREGVYFDRVGDPQLDEMAPVTEPLQKGRCVLEGALLVQKREKKWRQRLLRREVNAAEDVEWSEDDDDYDDDDDDDDDDGEGDTGRIGSSYALGGEDEDEDLQLKPFTARAQSAREARNRYHICDEVDVWGTIPGERRVIQEGSGRDTSCSSSPSETRDILLPRASIDTASPHLSRAPSRVMSRRSHAGDEGSRTPGGGRPFHGLNLQDIRPHANAVGSSPPGAAAAAAGLDGAQQADAALFARVVDAVNKIQAAHFVIGREKRSESGAQSKKQSFSRISLEKSATRHSSVVGGGGGGAPAVGGAGNISIMNNISVANTPMALTQTQAASAFDGGNPGTAAHGGGTATPSALGSPGPSTSSNARHSRGDSGVDGDAALRRSGTSTTWSAADPSQYFNSNNQEHQQGHRLSSAAGGCNTPLPMRLGGCLMAHRPLLRCVRAAARLVTFVLMRSLPPELYQGNADDFANLLREEEQMLLGIFDAEVTRSIQQEIHAIPQSTTSSPLYRRRSQTSSVSLGRSGRQGSSCSIGQEDSGVLGETTHSQDTAGDLSSPLALGRKDHLRLQAILLEGSHSGELTGQHRSTSPGPFSLQSGATWGTVGTTHRPFSQPLELTNVSSPLEMNGGDGIGSLRSFAGMGGNNSATPANIMAKAASPTSVKSKNTTNSHHHYHHPLGHNGSTASNATTNVGPQTVVPPSPAVTAAVKALLVRSTSTVARIILALLRNCMQRHEMASRNAIRLSTTSLSVRSPIAHFQRRASIAAYAASHPSPILPLPSDLEAELQRLAEKRLTAGTKEELLSEAAVKMVDTYLADSIRDDFPPFPLILTTLLQTLRNRTVPLVDLKERPLFLSPLLVMSHGGYGLAPFTSGAYEFLMMNREGVDAFAREFQQTSSQPMSLLHPHLEFKNMLISHLVSRHTTLLPVAPLMTALRLCIQQNTALELEEVQSFLGSIELRLMTDLMDSFAELSNSFSHRHASMLEEKDLKKAKNELISHVTDQLEAAGVAPPSTAAARRSLHDTVASGEALLRMNNNKNISNLENSNQQEYTELFFEIHHETLLEWSCVAICEAAMSSAIDACGPGIARFPLPSYESTAILTDDQVDEVLGSTLPDLVLPNIPFSYHNPQVAFSVVEKCRSVMLESLVHLKGELYYLLTGLDHRSRLLEIHRCLLQVVKGGSLRRQQNRVIQRAIIPTPEVAVPPHSGAPADEEANNHHHPQHHALKGGNGGALTRSPTIVLGSMPDLSAGQPSRGGSISVKRQAARSAVAAPLQHGAHHSHSGGSHHTHTHGETNPPVEKNTLDAMREVTMTVAGGKQCTPLQLVLLSLPMVDPAATQQQRSGFGGRASPFPPPPLLLSSPTPVSSPTPAFGMPYPGTSTTNAPGDAASGVSTGAGGETPAPCVGRSTSVSSCSSCCSRSAGESLVMSQGTSTATTAAGGAVTPGIQEGEDELGRRTALESPTTLVCSPSADSTIFSPPMRGPAPHFTSLMSVAATMTRILKSVRSTGLMRNSSSPPPPPQDTILISLIRNLQTMEDSRAAQNRLNVLLTGEFYEEGCPWSTGNKNNSGSKGGDAGEQTHKAATGGGGAGGVDASTTTIATAVTGGTTQHHIHNHHHNGTSVGASMASVASHSAANTTTNANNNASSIPAPPPLMSSVSSPIINLPNMPLSSLSSSSSHFGLKQAAQGGSGNSPVVVREYINATPYLSVTEGGGLSGSQPLQNMMQAQNAPPLKALSDGVDDADTWDFSYLYSQEAPGVVTAAMQKRRDALPRTNYCPPALLERFCVFKDDAEEGEERTSGGCCTAATRRAVPPPTATGSSATGTESSTSSVHGDTTSSGRHKEDDALEEALEVYIQGDWDRTKEAALRAGQPLPRRPKTRGGHHTSMAPPPRKPTTSNGRSRGSSPTDASRPATTGGIKAVRHNEAEPWYAEGNPAFPHNRLIARLKRSKPTESFDLHAVSPLVALKTCIETRGVDISSAPAVASSRASQASGPAAYLAYNSSGGGSPTQLRASTMPHRIGSGGGGSGSASGEFTLRAFVEGTGGSAAAGSLGGGPPAPPAFDVEMMKVNPFKVVAPTFQRELRRTATALLKKAEAAPPPRSGKGRTARPAAATVSVPPSIVHHCQRGTGPASAAGGPRQHTNLSLRQRGLRFKKGTVSWSKASKDQPLQGELYKV